MYKSIIEEPQTPRETVVVPTSDPTPKPQVTFFETCVKIHSHPGIGEVEKLLDL